MQEEPSVALVLRRRIRQLTEELQHLRAAMQRQQGEGKGAEEHQLSLQEGEESGSRAEQGTAAQGEQEQDQEVQGQGAQGQVLPAAVAAPLQQSGQPGPDEVADVSQGQAGGALRRWPVQQLATGLCIVAALIGICAVSSSGSYGLSPCKTIPYGSGIQLIG